MVVGKIIEVWNHPEEGKEHLYCEKVDIGNGQIRNIGSGLVKHLTMD